MTSINSNTPTFKIHGLERRKLKHKLSELKSFYKTFWYYHQMDKDLALIYGGSENYPMSDEKAQIKYNETALKIKELEDLLSVPYLESF